MSVIVRDYPFVVIGLITGKYEISNSGITSPSGVGEIHITVMIPVGVKQHFSLYVDDFKKCKHMAELFSQGRLNFGPMSAFNSEPLQDFRARIAARLEVEFAGR